MPVPHDDDARSGDAVAMLALTPVATEVKRAAIAGRPVAGLAQAEVFTRWERSRGLGADPDGRSVLEEAVVSAPRLAEARARTEEFRHCASTVLDGFAVACERSDFVGVLAGADGIVVDTFGGGSFDAEAKRLRLIAGAHWDEGLRGTNAIGTALAEGRPVAVHGAAHYARVNEGLVCFAAPIIDPRGEVVGILDATSHVDRASAFDPGVVLTVARAIEEVLRARAYAGSGGGIALVERLMERAAGAAFLVERPAGRRPGPQGRVVRANRTARALFEAANEARLRGGDPEDADALRGLVPPWRELEGLASGDPYAQRTVLVGTLSFELVVEPVHGADGRTVAMLVLLNELVPRPRATAPRRESPFANILGTDAKLDDARTRSSKLAKSTLPVLLLAETGTGKELFARAIHDASPRSEGPYIAVNCGAIQPELLLTELFGHGPGAFTGAQRAGRDGYVAAADGGTLFLDEVADLSPDAQVALLRVLEDGRYQRVGETTERSVDLRIVAATSRDLHERVARGEFRDDLYFRIGGACLALPTLRERSDLDELIDLFWSRARTPDGDVPPLLAAATRDALKAYGWPGNVRELESALGYAAVMAEGEAETLPEHLPPQVAAGAPIGGEQRSARPKVSGEPRPKAAQPTGLDAARKDALIAALERNEGNVSAAARELGVARSTVYRLAKRLGL